ncbi:hypothetical protein GCM10023238_26260 [Streptomyces heliomycini]
MTRTGEVWIEQGDETVATERPEYPAQDTTKAVAALPPRRRRLRRLGPAHWTGAANPTDCVGAAEPVKTDTYGAVFECARRGCHRPQLHPPQGRREDLPTDRSLDLKANGTSVAGERAGEAPAAASPPGPRPLST